MQDASADENGPAVQTQGQIAPGGPIPHHPWYREGKFVIALVTAILGTSGIAGTVQVILEDYRKTAELEIAKTNNAAHLKLEQEKQHHDIALAREQQRHTRYCHYVDAGTVSFLLQVSWES
jgi:hypothetical protein